MTDTKTIQSLRSALNIAEHDLDAAKLRYEAKKRELTNIESEMIELREIKRTIEDQILHYEASYEAERSLDDERNDEIEGFRTRLPKAMAAIEGEPEIPKVWSGTLDGGKPAR